MRMAILRAGGFGCFFHLTVAVSALTFASSAQEPPQIVEVQPPTGTMNVPLTTPVTIKFSKPMNTAVTTAQFVNILAFPPQIVAVTTTWSADKTEMINTPNQPYAPMTQIQWQMVVAQDIDGLPLEGLRAGTFFTGQAGTPPKLLSVDPPNQATNVAANVTAVFTFNVAMNQSTTRARFFDLREPTREFPANNSWNIGGTVLSANPLNNFPDGAQVLWRVDGADAGGNIFPGAGGGFTVAGMQIVTNKATAVISLGEVWMQVETNLLELEGQEFAAVVASPRENQLIVSTPGGRTNILGFSAPAQAKEYADLEEKPDEFNAKYPEGEYQLMLLNRNSEATAAIQITSNELPLPPRMNSWQSQPHAVAGQPLAMGWAINPGGPAIDYMRLRIARGGKVLFATPAPGEDGSLTGDSNLVTVPAAALANIGSARVTLTAFSFIATNSNSAPGITVYGARHRTTMFNLRIIDGQTPPPTLARTNINALPTEEPLFIALKVTNGVRPIRFRLVSGELPPGVSLDEAGMLNGTATATGLFSATVQMTDLLGRSVNQELQLGTVPLPPGSKRPTLENMALTGPDLLLDLVDPTPLNTILEHSGDLLQWTPYYTNAAGARRARVALTMQGAARFVRARANFDYPPQPVVNPLAVQPLMNPTVTKSATFDDFGGTLRLTNASGVEFTLVIPPAALNRPETITMTEVSQIAGLPLRGGLIAAVDLKPEGLLFDRLVRLDIKPPATVESPSLVGFNAQNAGTRFGLQPSFLTNNTVSLHLRHFSLAGAGSAASGDTSAQAGRPPSEGSGRSEQNAADEMARCRMDPNCDINSEEQQAKLRDIFVREADQTVIPKLREAMGSDSAVEQAILGWLAWVRQVSLTVYNGDAFNAQGSGPLEVRLRLTENLAGQVLREAIRFNCDLCVKSEVRRIARVITFSRWAAALGFDAGNEPFSCMQKCLKFKVNINSIIDSLNEGRTLKTACKAEIDLSPKVVDGSSDILTLEGSGDWTIEEMKFPSLPKECKSPTAATTGTADIKLLRISLYRQKTVTTDEGEFVTYEFAPQVTLSIKADRDDMPSEGRTLTCADLVTVDVEDVYGPTFMAFHNDEVEMPAAGSLAGEILGGPVFTISDFFDPGSGQTLMDKLYIRDQPIKDGVVGERTTIEVLHNP